MYTAPPPYCSKMKENKERDRRIVYRYKSITQYEMIYKKEESMIAVEEKEKEQMNDQLHQKYFDQKVNEKEKEM